MSLNTQALALLRLMADGDFHSGEVLGERLGVSRAAVWKILESFSVLGLEITRVRGKGYCVCGGVDFLDGSKIHGLLPPEIADAFSELAVFPEVSSTNQVLLDRINSGQNCVNASVCLAEMQSAGRGRRGRVWQSPFAQNIYLSLSWCFESGIAAMEGLSLAVGLGVVRSLKSLGLQDVGLKWPNDIICDNAKLGGVLIEIAGDVGGQCQAVIGIGINVRMNAESMREVDQPWVDLCALVDNVPPRNKIVAALLEHLFPIVSNYESKGFACYRSEWQEHCHHIGRSVCLETTSERIEGEMLGVDDSGSLCLEVDGQERSFIGGEVSLRLGL